MNSKRRTQLKEALALLARASSIIDVACDAERDCLDNMPENLQDSDRAAKMEDAIDAMEEAVDKIDEAVDCVERASV